MSGRGIRGALEGVVHGVVIGWAVDDGRPSHAVIVELLWEGVPVALDRADHVGLGDPAASAQANGIAIRLPRHILEQGGVVALRVANSDRLLGEFRIGDPPIASGVVARAEQAMEKGARPTAGRMSEKE